MTILSSTSRTDYVGNGNVSTYSYTFKIFNEADMQVTVADTDGVETTLTLTTDYTLTGVGNSAGGTVVLVYDEQPWLDEDGHLLNGYALTLRRVVDVKQETDIRNQGAFYPETHENAFDALVMIDQQQQDELNRSLKIPETEDSIGPLPSVADRASKFAAYDADGDPIASAGTVDGSVPVSAFMETVLDDTTAGAARTTLGFDALNTYVQNVKAYGAVGDGVTDDTTAIQDALDAAGKIYFPEGTYLLSDTLDLSSNTEIVMDKGAVIDGSALSSGTDIMLGAGTEGAATNLSANATAGYRSLSVASTTGFAANDLIRVFSDAQYDTSNTDSEIGELVEIEGFQGTTILLKTPLMDSYATADTARITKVTPIENVSIRGGKILGGGNSLDHDGLMIQLGRNITIEGVWFQSVSNIACQLRDTIDSRVLACRFETADDNTGYGVSIANASQDIVVSHNHFKDCRHSLSTNNSTATAGIPRRVIFSDNTVVDSAVSEGTTYTFTADTGTDVITTSGTLVSVSLFARAVRFSTTGTLPAPLVAGVTYYVRKLTNTTYTIHLSAKESNANANIIDLTSAGSGTHSVLALGGGDAIDSHGAAEDIHIWNNTVMSSSGVGINFECSKGSIIGNAIYNTLSESIYVHNESDRSGEIIVANNICKGMNENGIYVSKGTRGTSAVYRSVVVTGNSIFDCPFPSISVVSTTTENKEVVISNNVITGSTYAGMNIQVTLANGCTISGNSIGAFANAGGQGIKIDDSKNVAITGNSITLPATPTGIGIWLDSTNSGDTRYVTVAGNMVYNPGSGSGDEGIFVDNNVLDAVIVGNHFPNAATPIRLGTGLGNGVIGDPEYQRQNATIASGVITLQSRYVKTVGLNSEAAAATDDLDTISGGYTGQVITLNSNSSSQDITFTDGTGNLRLAGAFSTATSSDTIQLLYNGTNWLEISRSTN